jgi:hypothetical protein
VSATPPEPPPAASLLDTIPVLFAFRVERTQELLLLPNAPSDARVLRLAMTKTAVLQLAHDLLSMVAQIPTETDGQLMMTTVSIPGVLMKDPSERPPVAPLPFVVPR